MAVQLVPDTSKGKLGMCSCAYRASDASSEASKRKNEEHHPAQPFGGKKTKEKREEERK